MEPQDASQATKASIGLAKSRPTSIFTQDDPANRHPPGPPSSLVRGRGTSFGRVQKVTKQAGKPGSPLSSDASAWTGLGCMPIHREESEKHSGRPREDTPWHLGPATAALLSTVGTVVWNGNGGIWRGKRGASATILQLPLLTSHIRIQQCRQHCMEWYQCRGVCKKKPRGL